MSSAGKTVIVTGAGGAIVNICSLAVLPGHYTAAYTARRHDHEPT